MAEPGTYVVLERYIDQAAFEAHVESEHFKRVDTRLRDCADGAPVVTHFGDPI